MPHNKLNIADHIGKKYGKLTVVKETGVKGGHTMCLCKCDCGNHKEAALTHVVRGKVKSCGCLHKSIAKEHGIMSATHGLSKHPLYGVWSTMKSRCYNPKNKSYNSYGAKGITVCKDWLNDFHAFYRWAMDNGYRKGLTVERKDISKGYSPDNCELIPLGRQASNKSTSFWVTIGEETKILKDWCSFYGMPYTTVYQRIKRGMSIEEALTKPVKR